MGSWPSELAKKRECQKEVGYPDANNVAMAGWHWARNSILKVVEEMRHAAQLGRIYHWPRNQCLNAEKITILRADEIWETRT